MERDLSKYSVEKEENLEYWIQMAKDLGVRNCDVEKELEDYRESSMLYERELETSCEVYDQKIHDLEKENFRLSDDNALLKVQLKRQISEQSILQDRHQELKEQYYELEKMYRRLEQKNDDLERRNRETKVSEEDLECQYDIVLEKLALLETEIEERKNFKAIIERLTDENEDLKATIQNGRRQQEIAMEAIGNDFESDVEHSVQTYRSIGSISSSVDCVSSSEQGVNHCENSLVSYIEDLEQEVKKLQETNKIRRITGDELKVNLEKAARTLAHYETDPQEVHQHLLHSDSSNLTFLCSPTKHGNNQHLTSSGNSNQHIKIKVKKVKDGKQRRRNLALFLKQLRKRQPSWLNKNK